MDAVLDNATYVDNQLGIVYTNTTTTCIIQEFPSIHLKAERIYRYVYTQKSPGMTVNLYFSINPSQRTLNHTEKPSLLIKNVEVETDTTAILLCSKSQEFGAHPIRG